MSSLDVKKIRALTGKSQTEFAELLGVTRSSVTLWESNDLDKRTKPKLAYELQMKKIESQYKEVQEDVSSEEKEDKEFSDLKIDDKLNIMNDKLNTLNELLNI